MWLHNVEIQEQTYKDRYALTVGCFILIGVHFCSQITNCEKKVGHFTTCVGTVHIIWSSSERVRVREWEWDWEREIYIYGCMRYRIASRVTQKSLFTVTNVLFYFFHAILYPGYINSAKSNYQSPISPLSLRTVFTDVALSHHHKWSVTSRERGVLALWRQIRRLFLHPQIVQSRSSLLNNNREYRFLTTRYSRLSV